MASRPFDSQGGPADGEMDPDPGAPPRRFTRPFTLYEALPFSPFTSGLHDFSSTIPLPMIGVGLPASEITDSSPREDYDLLNQESSQLSGPSKRLDHALEQVQRLLGPNRVTELTFRKAPKASPNANLLPASSSVATKLSPFAKLVLDNTNVAYRHPTPDSSVPPETQTKVSSPVLPKKQRSPVMRKSDPPKAKSTLHTATNKKAHAQNAARLEINISPLPQPKPHPPSPAPSVPPIPTPTPVVADGAASVVVDGTAQLSRSPSEAAPPPPPAPPRPQSATPARSTSLETGAETPIPPAGTPVLKSPSVGREVFRVDISAKAKEDKDQYVDMKDLIYEPTSLSERRQTQDGYGESQDVYGLDLDQQQKSRAAFQELCRHFGEIFAAEGNLSTQPSARQLVTVTNDGVPTITTQAQQKAYTLVEKAIELRCFSDAPVDDLLHIQKLSEGALKHAEGLEVKVDEEWGAGDVATWATQLPEIDNGLRAARTSLKIMSGGREDRQLYSEDTIQLAVDVFKRVVDGIVVPVTELRHSGPTERLFGLITSHKRLVLSVFTSCQRLYSLMASLVSTIDLSDTVMSTLEFLSTRMIFVENAQSDRESVLGTQKFDGLRYVAMDMLSQIFLLNPSQRQGIFDDILSSLAKLPVGKQSSRQFRIFDGKSIQTVSALIMRLVQASASNVDDSRARDRQKVLASLEEDEDDAGPAGPSGRERAVSKTGSTITSEEEAATMHAGALHELMEIESSLMETAQRNAGFVSNFLVARALKSTKSGDEPFRNLLDLFVEDLATCLDSPDWPAAELLLRKLMTLSMGLIEGERTPAPSKNMALEVLGSMGAAISKVRSQVRKTGNLLLDAAESGGDDLSTFLVDLAAQALDGKAQPEQMLAWAGPYRAVLEYLESRRREDPHLVNAVSLMVAHWANQITSADKAFGDEDSERDQEFGRLAYRLRMMILDRAWLSNEYKFKQVSPAQAKAAYALTILRMQLCESFPHIINILLRSMDSDQATVRSKSIKSINQVIDTDPSILDGESQVVQLILQCTSDSSTQVRDSALGLIGKCINLRPVLEAKMVDTVLDRFSDAGIGVRKRALKLAKEIYLRNTSKSLRSNVASHMLQRVQDPDEGVRELARQMVEETWFFPFCQTDSTSAAADKASLTDHVALMLRTIKPQSMSQVLERVLNSVLAPESKTAKQVSIACRKLVATLFDMVDRPDAVTADPSAPSSRDALQALLIFAKADPNLFSFEQIRLLRPHILLLQPSHGNASADDWVVCKSAVSIYRRVLPELKGQHHEPFLKDIFLMVLPSIGTGLSRAILDETVGMLWVMAEIIGSIRNIGMAVASALLNIIALRNALRNRGQLDDKSAKRLQRCCLIVGLVAKHCPLDRLIDHFREKIPKWQGTSPSKLMVDEIMPLTRRGVPMDIREAALEAAGLICHSWPRNYVSKNVIEAFQEVFSEREPLLERKVLESLKEFLTYEERRSDRAAEASMLNGTTSTTTANTPVKAKKAANQENGTEKPRVSDKELTVMGGTNFDDVASATTQRFLKDVTRIAMATMDDHAFLAVEVLASINRQGLVHPKETFVTMMTLETCPVRKISELALSEHRLLHEKHESTLEREYARALQAVFQYQRDNVGDPRGATVDPESSAFTAKLHLMVDVLKISKSKNRQRFLQKVCSLIDFDPAKLDAGNGRGKPGSLPAHVEYTRFLIENLAFFEYVTIGELQLTITAMERLVTGTGATVAHAIESDIFQVRIDGPAENGTQPPTNGEDPSQPPPLPPPVAPQQHQAFFAPPVDLARLRQLTAGSMILSSLWEARTYLRKLYGLKAERRTAGEGGGKPKAAAKDTSKAPVKNTNVPGDKVWDDIASIMRSLESEDAMMTQCRGFVELLNVDKEFKIADEDAAAAEEDGMTIGGGGGANGGPATPSDDGDGDDDGAGGGGGPGSGRGRKRKASNTPGGGRGKKRARSGSQPRKRGRPRKNPAPDDDPMDESGDWM